LKNHLLVSTLWLSMACQKKEDTAAHTQQLGYSGGSENEAMEAARGIIHSNIAKNNKTTHCPAHPEKLEGCYLTRSPPPGEEYSGATEWECFLLKKGTGRDGKELRYRHRISQDEFKSCFRSAEPSQVHPSSDPNAPGSQRYPEPGEPPCRVEDIQFNSNGVQYCPSQQNERPKKENEAPRQESEGAW